MIICFYMFILYVCGKRKKIAKKRTKIKCDYKSDLNFNIHVIV